MQFQTMAQFRQYLIDKCEQAEKGELSADRAKVIHSFVAQINQSIGNEINAARLFVMAGKPAPIFGQLALGAIEGEVTREAPRVTKAA
jgi:hypothetical protein